MTNQEIIEQLESLKSHCEDFKNEEDCVWSKDVEALDRAIEALEKQTPTKPNYVYEDEPLCPYCGAVLDDCESPCENCNQFIDWSDSDD